MYPHVEIRVSEPLESQSSFQNRNPVDFRTKLSREISGIMPQNPPRGPDRISGKSKRSELFETKLLKICNDWIEWGHEIKSYDFVSSLANALHEHDKGRNGPAEDIGEWATEFRNQRPAFQKTRDDAQKQSRQEKEVVAKGWISMVRRLTKQYNIDPEDMYAVREIGYYTSKTSSRRAVTLVRPSHEKLAALPKGRSMASAIHCFSGAGKILVPWVMTQEKEQIRYKTFGDIQYASNLTGWASISEWKLWLHNCFEPETRKSPLERSRWRLMLVNGYQTPFDESCFLFCRERKILCISYPRLCRQDLDPFHFRVFPNIEDKYRRLIDLRLKEFKKTEQSDSAELRLDTRTFVAFLSKISFAGPETEKAERRIEAENAWKSYTIMMGSMGSSVKTHLTSNMGCWKNREGGRRNFDTADESARIPQDARSQEVGNQDSNEEIVSPTLNEGITTCQANVNPPSVHEGALDPTSDDLTPSIGHDAAKEGPSSVESSERECQLSASKTLKTQVSVDGILRSRYFPQPAPSARQAIPALTKAPLAPPDSGRSNVAVPVSKSRKQGRSLSRPEKQKPLTPEEKEQVCAPGQKLEQSTAPLREDDLPTNSQSTNLLALRPKGCNSSLGQPSSKKRSVHNPFDTFDKAMKRIKTMPEAQQEIHERKLNDWLDQTLGSSSFAQESDEES
ncbi:hypothetical protein N7488_004347 [Penicillium malachiteum]|nr:hypothetical protein N7488_004347 [Penicillium malachiteum]